jgi:hypothetical protein
MHGATPQEASWHYSVWLHEGERRASSVNLWQALASPSEDASGLNLFGNVAAGNKNSRGITAELATQQLAQTYSIYGLRDGVLPNERS